MLSYNEYNNFIMTLTALENKDLLYKELRGEGRGREADTLLL